MLFPYVAAFLIVFSLLKYIVRRRLATSDHQTIGFFHPYSNDGGGGERVLWCAVHAIQSKWPSAKCVIYTGHGSSANEILKAAKDRFCISLPRPVQFVFLQKRHWVEASRYPRLTLIGQSLGSMVLAWEAVSQLMPDIFFDTMGYAFTYPLVKLLSVGRCRVACYVHYPTISTDMLALVVQRRPTFNNAPHIARSVLFTYAKHLYYILFAALYGLVGRFSDVVMVNSSWTKGHIDALWGRPHLNVRVYPPCDTASLQSFPLHRDGNIIVSLAQFRPEKDHSLQLRAIAKLVQDEFGGSPPPDLKLVLIGSCRNAEDRNRLDQLRRQSEDLGIQAYVSFIVNAPWDDVMTWLSTAVVGIHTMWNEHFGIAVVQYMAAGVVPVAHNSGGPQADIVVPFGSRITGFLAATEAEYAAALHRVLSMSPQERLPIQQAARESVRRFSDSEFASELQSVMASLLR